MIPVGPDRPDTPSTTLRVRRLPERIASLRPIDAAEAFRDLPGLALLESARPGRNARWTYLTADPIAVLESPAAGSDPFAVARRLLARLDGSPVADDAPPFIGGLVGYLGYDLGHVLERLPSIAVDDQGLPPLRLGLHDWVVAWDRRTGRAWLAGRALDGDARRLARRLDDVHARLTSPVSSSPPRPTAPMRFQSSLSRPAYEARVERIRQHIADGDIYQANLTRRLEAPFDDDPWEPYRLLRTGDPSLFSAFLDLGASPETGRRRALLSASPEPFLSLDAAGIVASDPIKGTRPRGRDRAEDRALACELLSSAKDRAENVMIVDVLRNDLARVCRPGTVRVPRLCRLERTAAVQHLVSTVTGRLAPGRRCLRPPGGELPGRLDHRCAEDPGDGDPRGSRAGPPRPVHGRARLDRGRRGDADQHPDPHLRRRRSAADAARRWRHHVGQRSGRRMGGDRRQGARPARRARRRGGGVTDDRRATPGHVWVDGEILPADGAHLSVFDRGFQLGDGVFETLRARAGRVTELDEHLARLHRSAAGLDIELPRDVDDRLADGIGAAARRGRSRRAGGRRVDPDHGLARCVSRPWCAARPTRTCRPRSRSRPGPCRPRRPIIWSAASTSSTSSVRRDPQNPLATLKTTSRAEYVYARLEARRAGADDALFLTIDDHLSEGTSANIFLVRRAGSDGSPELATPSLDCAILPGTTRSWLLEWAARVGLRPVEGRLERRDLAAADEAFLSSSVAGILPVTTFDGAPIGDGRPGPWTPPRPRGSRVDDPRRRAGAPMTRDELISRTRQLIDEGDRLLAQPSMGAMQLWLQLSDDLLATAWGSMDRYHLAWLMVGKPKSIVRGRPMTPDEEAAYVREVASQKTAALRMSLDAVDRQGMPFVGETGGGLGEGRTTDRSEPGVDDRPPPVADRAPDRAGLPPDPTLADRLAEARRRAEAHRDHDERRAPRPDRMQR